MIARPKALHDRARTPVRYRRARILRLEECLVEWTVTGCAHHILPVPCRDRIPEACFTRAHCSAGVSVAASNVSTYARVVMHAPGGRRNP